MADTVKIKITRATVCGGVSVFEGDVVTASKRDAHTLLRMGKAVPAEVEKKSGKTEK